MPKIYEIVIKGHLDPDWSDWFGGLQVTHLEGDRTRISGAVSDQAALHGLIERLRDLNLELLSVRRINPK